MQDQSKDKWKGKGKVEQMSLGGKHQSEITNSKATIHHKTKSMKKEKQMSKENLSIYIPPSTARPFKEKVSKGGHSKGKFLNKGNLELGGTLSPSGFKNKGLREAVVMPQTTRGFRDTSLDQNITFFSGPGPYGKEYLKMQLLDKKKSGGKNSKYTKMNKTKNKGQESGSQERYYGTDIGLASGRSKERGKSPTVNLEEMLAQVIKSQNIHSPSRINHEQEEREHKLLGILYNKNLDFDRALQERELLLQKVGTLTQKAKAVPNLKRLLVEREQEISGLQRTMGDLVSDSHRLRDKFLQQNLYKSHILDLKASRMMSGVTKTSVDSQAFKSPHIGSIDEYLESPTTRGGRVQVTQGIEGSVGPSGSVDPLPLHSNPLTQTQTTQITYSRKTSKPSSKQKTRGQAVDLPPEQHKIKQLLSQLRTLTEGGEVPKLIIGHTDLDHNQGDRKSDIRSDIRSEYIPSSSWTPPKVRSKIGGGLQGSSIKDKDKEMDTFEIMETARDSAPCSPFNIDSSTQHEAPGGLSTVQKAQKVLGATKGLRIKSHGNRNLHLYSSQPILPRHKQPTLPKTPIHTNTNISYKQALQELKIKYQRGMDNSIRVINLLRTRVLALRTQNAALKKERNEKGKGKGKGKKASPIGPLGEAILHSHIPQ